MSGTSEIGETTGLEIAVVGMAGRFPAARNIDEFWHNLKNAVESITFFSEEELLRAGNDPDLVRHPNYVAASGVLEGAERFDAAFFGFSPKEAAVMDPQQRVLLETAWAALEHAGYVPETYAGAIGIYAGCWLSQYFVRNVLGSIGFSAPETDYQTVLGTDRDFLTTRVSYKLGLGGPSVTVQSACSTSLVAIHLACQALLSAECDMALAGGVTVRVPQIRGYVYVEDGPLSADGHCRAFDENARGSNPGSGVALVVLKRLADALADGDYIHAIVKGTAINNDGGRRVGYTAPSVEGQAKVIGAAQRVSETTPDTIGYVEAHGTATALGDPIEIEALTRAFREQTDRKGYCAIGSVKTNVGHLDAAAGVAGFVKAALAVRDGWLPPSLHFNRPNPRIDFENSPFYVNSSLRRWQNRSGRPRRAGVSSFGIGGTNAHVILEEPPERPLNDRAECEELLVLSAKSLPALASVQANLAAHLRGHSGLNLGDVAFTLRRGRAHFRFRRSIVAATVADAAALLERAVEGQDSGQGKPVAFLFPGQGSQYPNMARGLYESEPEFRIHIDRAFEIRTELGLELRDVLYPQDEPAERAGRQLDDTRLAQPALFAVSYALARLWMSFGQIPVAMLGHSVGEYVAACVSGVITFEDAFFLVAERGRLMSEMAPGAMLAVPLAPRMVEPFLGVDIDLAAVNAPEVSVVAGPVASVQRLQNELRTSGIESRLLRTSHAFHSSMMEPVMKAFAEAVAKVELRVPQIPFISNVTGSWISPDEARDPGYWVTHLRSTVNFSQGIQTLLRGSSLLLEVGPGRTLTRLVARHKRGGNSPVVFASTRHADEKRADRGVVLEALGGLWSHGAVVDWESVTSDRNRRRVPLPSYPFEGERFWLEPTSSETELEARVTRGKRSDLSRWFSTPSWERIPSDRVRPGAPTQGSDVWLIFRDRYGLASEIADRLQADSQTVVIVDSGRVFAQAGERRFEIEPGASGDYRKLCKTLAFAGHLPTRVVHCWLAEPDGDAVLPSEEGERQVERGFFSLLYLIQALADEAPGSACRLTVVSSQVHSVTGEETIRAEKATVLGPCRVAPLEYPSLQMEQIDIPNAEAQTAQRQRTVELLMECLWEARPAPVVAIRGTHRWVQAFAPLRMDPASSTLFKEGGVYVITGGMGGIGLALATHLARTVKAKLVLIGRTPLPDRSQWEAWLSAERAAEVSVATRDWARLEVEFANQAGVGPASSFDGFRDALDTLCTSYVLRFLADHGIDIRRARNLDRAELKRELGVVPKLDRYFEKMLRCLVEDGFLSANVDTLRPLEGKHWPDAVALERQTVQDYPAFRRIVELLGHCVRHWEPVIKGEIPPLEVLFGEEGRDLFQAGIENTAEHSYVSVYQKLIGKLLSHLLDSRKSTLRILEVGGGEGRLTKALAPALKERDIEYHFTDIGRSFIVNAEKFAKEEGLDFMRFGAFDISKSPSEQGFAKGRFDLVLAFNVVHATSNVAATLSHLEEVLAPGGYLVLLESIRPERWVDLVWGLTDGWWLFEGDPLRSGSPLLTLDAWTQLVQRQGFEPVEAFPRAEELLSKSDCGVVVARKPSSPESMADAELHSAARIRAIQNLEALGSQVEVACADVADRDQMQKVADAAMARFGAVDGVIHAALVLNDGTMQLKTRAAAESVLSPKVRGTRVVAEVFQGQNLDFFVTFSSLVSVTGGIGQVDYCAASNFQDAFAQSSGPELAKSVLSIDWAAWREVGMAMRAALARGEAPQHVLPEGMTTAEGIEAFERVLAGTRGQVLVSPESLETLREKARGARAVESHEAAQDDRAPSSPRDGFEAPRNEAERVLAEIWQELLGIESVGIRDNFFERGGDSVVSLQFIARARKAGMQFTNSQVFEHQTIAELSALCASEKGDPRRD